MTTHQNVAGFRCSVSNVEYLPQEIKLPFWVEKSIRLIQQDQAIAVFEQFDDGIDVNRLELTVTEQIRLATAVLTDEYIDETRAVETQRKVPQVLVVAYRN